MSRGDDDGDYYWREARRHAESASGLMDEADRKVEQASPEAAALIANRAQAHAFTSLAMAQFG